MTPELPVDQDKSKMAEEDPWARWVTCALFPPVCVWILACFLIVLPLTQEEETAMLDFLRGAASPTGKVSARLETWDVACLYFIMSLPLSLTVSGTLLACSWVTQTRRVKELRAVVLHVFYMCFLGQVAPVCLCFVLPVLIIVPIFFTYFLIFAFMIKDCVHPDTTVLSHTCSRACATLFYLFALALYSWWVISLVRDMPLSTWFFDVLPFLFQAAWKMLKVPWQLTFVFCRGLVPF